MKKLLIAIVTTLVFSTAAFAGTAQDYKSLSNKLWNNSQKSTLKAQKHDLTIVYGGEDISHKLSADATNA